LDEGFLDVTGSEHLFNGASTIGHEIKRRTKENVGLTCSVGIGYSMMSAKLASEEKKPDGFFEILTPEDLRNLIIDRNVRVIYGVGAKTADDLKRIGITTVRDIYNHQQIIINIFSSFGKQIVELAEGIDRRKVTPYSEPKSIGNEHTFQHDTRDFDYLKDVLLLIAQKLSYDIRLAKLYCRTITLKVTYGNMKQITRSHSGDTTNRAMDIYKTVTALLDKIEKQPIRLIGISLSNLSTSPNQQMTLFDTFDTKDDNQRDKLDDTLMKLQLKYGRGIIKTADELRAEKRIGDI